MPPSGENPVGGPWGPPADQPPQQSPGQPTYQGPPYPGQQSQGQQSQGEQYGGQPPGRQYPAQQLAYPEWLTRGTPYGSVGGYGSGSPAGVQYGPGPRLPIIHPNKLRPGRLGYVIAAIIAVAAIIGGIVGFVIELGNQIGLGDDVTNGVVHLDKNAHRGIYTSGSVDNISQCIVSGPDGDISTVKKYTGDDGPVHDDGRTYRLAYTFTAPVSGNFQLRCTGNDLVNSDRIAIGPSSSSQVISDLGPGFAMLFGIPAGGFLIAAGVAGLTGSARAKDRRRQQDDIMRTNPMAYNYQGY